MTRQVITLKLIVQMGLFCIQVTEICVSIFPVEYLVLRHHQNYRPKPKRRHNGIDGASRGICERTV